MLQERGFKDRPLEPHVLQALAALVSVLRGTTVEPASVSGWRVQELVEMGQVRLGPTPTPYANACDEDAAWHRRCSSKMS